MAGFGIRMDLLDDVVLSASGATEGEHQTLDYVPGSALLGWAARMLYRTLTANDAWTVFHSGRVRFGDGMPLAENGLVGWPTPLSLHYPKDTPHGCIDAETRNLAIGNLAMDAQPEQRRSGALTDAGGFVKVRRSYRMRTAIAGKTGRADDGRLYGYAAIEAGVSFQTAVWLDKDAEHLESALRGAFDDQKIRIGRAKGTEYGRARATITTLPPVPTTSRWKDGDDVLIWLLSDTSLCDPLGLPTLEPTPQHFGLSSGTLDWDRSFLRFRRWAPWNRALQSRMPDREVLARGSVLCFRGAAAGSARAAAGFAGHYSREGCGYYVISPNQLSAPLGQIALSAIGSAEIASVSTKELSADEAAFHAWAIGSGSGDALSWAMAQCSELRGLYRSAVALSGRPIAEVGPSPTQWSVVLEQAKSANTVADLRVALFGPDENTCLIRSTDDAWAADISDGQNFSTFRGWLQGLLEEAADDRDALVKLRRLCEEARKLAISVRDDRWDAAA